MVLLHALWNEAAFARLEDAFRSPQGSRFGAVHLSRLSLRDFRNLGVQELAIPPEGVAILGANAQGKSNLLEAIYYLETFRSFRGTRDAQLVAFGCSVFRVEGEVHGDGGDASTIAAAFDRDAREKRVFVDGEVQETLSAGLGHVGAVIFSPDDVRMVNGPPAERRRFLDIVLCLNQPGYMAALQRYRRALAQRNAALKAGLAGDALEAWNRALATEGARLMEGRSAWVAERAESYADHYAAISGAEVATIEYRPSCRVGDGGDSSEEALRSALSEAEARDIRMRTTTVGPHRDELSIVTQSSRLEIREFGSGGQRRTAALALRLAEADTVGSARTIAPVLLMDDAFAELDQERTDRLLTRIESGEVGQVILTAPKEADVRVRKDRIPRWRIEGGRIAA